MAIGPPTPEQEAALAKAATGGVTAIAAGAGAGKTTLMVEAVWRDIERDGVPLDGIFVAAYNRAAAAHLAARLQHRFSDPDDGRGPGRVGLDLSQAWVGTFHSLAARIVRERPFAAGVDPEFGELAETEAAALVEQALDEAMEHAMAAALPGFLDLVGDATSVTGLREATRHVHERLRAAGHETPRIVVPEVTPPRPDLSVELETIAQRVEDHPRARDTHRESLAEVRQLLVTGEVGLKAPSLSLVAAADLKPLCEAVNALAAEAFQALLDREAVAQLAAFAAHLDAFAARYAELKRERGVLDYEDLLLAARRVLRREHGHRFARVYVDEFQDANALQSDIIELLAGERTVLVGDGCQAIYGFRHADSAHFVARVGDPPAVTLRDNHRSQDALMRTLNGLLADALRDEPTFQTLTPAARADQPGPPLADTPVEIVDVTSADGEKPTREQEADVVAGAVEDLVSRGYAPRDVAVVFRALTQVEPYRAALAARGIPVHLVAGRGFFTHDQVADTIALLALVENPFDEEELVRVLASPYVAAGDDDLVELRRAAGPPSRDRWPTEGALWPAVGGVAGTRPARELVAELRPLLRERGLAGLVEAATCARGYELAVLGMPDGARRHANLRRLVRMAASYAAVRGPDLRGFLTLLRTMAEVGNQDPGEAALVDPDLDAVRLATVHGVKGQQFPAVVIADASHAANSSAPMVVVDADGRAGIRVARVGGGAQPALGFDERLAAARAADRAEERRTTYVAATRAERHLVVVGRGDAWGNTDDGAYEVLRKATGLAEPGVREYETGGAVRLREVPVAPPTGASFRPRMEPGPTRAVPPPRATARVPADVLAGRAFSFSALSTFATCPLRFHLEYERGLRGRDDAVVADAARGRSLWGALAFGDFVHRVLEGHDWHGPDPAPGWAVGAARAVGLTDSPADRLRAERLVAALLASEVAERIRQGVVLIAERAFSLEIDGALVSGAIDLMVDEGDGRALLLDWKTHALGEGRATADILAEYPLQQALYGLAALRAGFREVALHWVVLEDITGSPVLVVGPDDATTLEARIRGAMEGLRRPGRPAVAITPQPLCGGCPGLDAMCVVAAAVRRRGSPPHDAISATGA